MHSKRARASVAFLRRWLPAGPWVLTCIDPNSGSVQTRGFGCNDAVAAERWITYWQDFDATQGEPRNIYFSVNVDTRRPEQISTKASKSDIAAVVALHADIDSYKDENPREGRERALRKFTEDGPAGVPGPPTAINLSGNGFNAFWRLKTPIILNGDIAKAVEVERYNRGLAQAFGGDMATDVSRIMRLPWSVNFPNQRKKARGLEAVLARQIHYDETQLYDQEDFEAADAPKCVAQLAANIEIGPAISIADLDDLEVPERTRIVIAAGAYPGEVRASRSEWLFSAICSLIRAGEPDEVILGVITDLRWAISASALEKPEPETYARRQIARAHAWLTNNMEHEFDE